MKRGKICITGGAGYIGSHLVQNLLKLQFPVLVLDNLSSGNIAPIEILAKKFGNLEFIKVDLADKNRLLTIFKKKQIDFVFHLAAKIDVAESMTNPELYHRENYINSINLMEAMLEAGVNRFVFSSTAAVYGEPKYTPIDENHPTAPENPYSQTKLDFETYLSRVENLNYLVFRYFNVCGSDLNGFIGKSHLKSNDLIENILRVALGRQESLKIYGHDYPTPDGTAIRDYIHVEDVVLAHILAMSYLQKLESPSIEVVYNLGLEQGFSVKEVLDTASLVLEKEIPVQNCERRSGDASSSIASSKKAQEILHWQPQYLNLEDMILSDWNWRKDHPLGYTK